MAITHEDIQEIKRVLDDRYVQIADCDTIQQNNNKRFANDDKRIDMMLLKQEETKHSIKFNNWLTTAILGVLIAGVVTYFIIG